MGLSRNGVENYGALGGELHEIAPDKARTCNLRFRRPTLYPIELQAQINHIFSEIQNQSYNYQPAISRKLGPEQISSIASPNKDARSKTDLTLKNSIDNCLVLWNNYAAYEDWNEKIVGRSGIRVLPCWLC